MERKPYRNAIRSKAMIRSAFIELLAEKPLEQITIVDIVNRSDLSRNTFYAHYQDIYAVLEEFQTETITQMNEALDEAVANQIFDNPLPLMNRIAAYVEENKETFRPLMSIEMSDAFINQLKDLIIVRINEHSDQTGIKDQRGFFVMLDVLVFGFIHQVKCYLRGESELTSAEIVTEINKLFRAALPLYR